MFERALSIRRKILRALKAQFRVEKSSSLGRKPVAVMSTNSGSETEILGLGPSDDGVPHVKYSCPQALDVVKNSEEVMIHNPGAAATDAIQGELRGLRSKTPLSVVVPPKPPVPIAAQTPLDTPGCGSSRSSSDVSQPNPSPGLLQDFAAQVEGYQEVQRQLQRRAITRARSMPVSSCDPISDPMRKLRDSYLRIMHKMAQEEAKMNPLSPAPVSTLEKDHSRLFDYLHRRRTPADDEEEEFCRLAVMRTKFNRSQSIL